MSKRSQRTTTPPSEAQAALVAGVALGREQDLEALYRGFRDRVHGLSLRMLGDPSRAEETTVEVFTRIWRRAASFDAARGDVGAWIRAITRSACLDALRQGGRRREHGIHLEADTALPSDGPEPNSAFERSERDSRVRDALVALPEEQASCLRAAFFQGMTYREVAESLGQPLGTVKTRIRLALIHLRRALEGAEEELI